MGADIQEISLDGERPAALQPLPEADQQADAPIAPVAKSTSGERQQSGGLPVPPARYSKPQCACMTKSKPGARDLGPVAPYAVVSKVTSAGLEGAATNADRGPADRLRRA